MCSSPRLPEGIFLMRSTLITRRSADLAGNRSKFKSASLSGTTIAGKSIFLKAPRLIHSARGPARRPYRSQHVGFFEVINTLPARAEHVLHEEEIIRYLRPGIVAETGIPDEEGFVPGNARNCRLAPQKRTRHTLIIIDNGSAAAHVGVVSSQEMDLAGNLVPMP
jgi:hypothetical protein